MPDDIRNILLAVCALGCTCAGLIGFVIFAVVRFAGSQVLPLIGDLLGGGRGDNADRDDTPARSGRSGRVSASEALRQRAKGSDFGGVAAAAVTAFTAMSQNDQQQDPAPYTRQPTARRQSGYPAQNDPLAFPGQSPTRPQAGYTAQNDPLAFSGQPPARPGLQPPAPQPPGYAPANPSLTPLAGRPAGFPAQPATPQYGARPTLSAGRAPSLSDDPFDANSLPGLRNQRVRRRTGDGDQIYDDGEGGGLGDIFDSLNPL